MTRLRSLLRCPRPMALFAVAGILLMASPAAATYETLRRSLGNILFAPFDMILSPAIRNTSRV